MNYQKYFSFNKIIGNNFFEQCAKYLLVCSIFFMPLGTVPTNSLIALTFISWLLAGNFYERLRFLKTSYFGLSILALFSLIFIGVSYSNSPVEDINIQIIKYLKLLFIIVAMSLLNEEKWRKRALNAFSLSMLTILVLSIFSAVIHFMNLNINSFGSPGNYYVFKDHISQNLMMSFFALLMLIKSTQQEKIFKKIGFQILFILAAIDVFFLVQGRTGYISMAINIFIAVFYLVPKERRWIFLIGIFISGLIIFQVKNNFSDRIKLAVTEFEHQDSKELTSIGQRIEFTKKSILLIKERPIFGWGTGSYPTQFCRVAISEEWCQAGKFHPHNQFLAFGVQLGLVGILTYLIFLGSIIKTTLTFQKNEKMLNLGIIGALITDSILHAPLFLVTEAHFFTLTLAVCMSYSLKNNKSSHNNYY